MIYIKKSSKSVQELVEQIVNEAPNFKFGVLNIHNIKNTLESKGLEFENECQILDICNPNIAKEFLLKDMNLASILPCKLSVYSKNDESYIVMNSIEDLVKPINDELIQIAKDVQKNLLLLVNKVL